VIAREERLGKNLELPSGEERVNLQIQEVFSKVSLRTGQNDARELDREKKMRWEGVSNAS
jgi:hypothetical protein